MTIRLRDLIKQVRACKTAAEEREVIAKESAALREAFRDQDQSYRHRNVAKLMYIHMLGYPTHFGQMETLKLIAASGFAEKRMGYLGLMILLDERQEVLMLVTNSLKMDLNNPRQKYIVGLALTALGNICSAEMARDLAPDVEKLLEHPEPYIRKKAALCAIRVVKKVPDLMEQFVDRAAEMINDRSQAAMLSGVSLMLTLVELDGSIVDKYRAYVPSLCKVLRALLAPGASPEHDVGGITNPFLQVKILRLLRMLGKGNAEASDSMSDILAQVSANIEGARNAGNAILYEAVQSIMGIESIGGLRVLAINILGRFLANKDNNMRYVALNTLAKVVAVDLQAVQRHRATIVECVKDADVSIRRRALELVYSLVNESNIKNLTRDLLEYLAVCDAEFKPDLTAKICTLIQRFAPDRRWHVDQLLAVLQQAGAHVQEEVTRALLVLITNTPELHGYATRAFYRALCTDLDAVAPALGMTAVWLIGEFGEMLLPSMGGPLLEGEAPLAVSDGDVVGLLEAVMRKMKEPPSVREQVLTAMMKLTARFPAQVQRLKATIAKNTTSALLEAQARACEFGKIFAYDTIRPQLLERMPALDEAEYLRSNNMLGGPGTASAGGGAADGAGSAVAAAAASTSRGGNDLLGGLDMLGDVGVSTSAPAKSAMDDLDALLGGVPSLAPAAPAAPTGGLFTAPAPAPATFGNDLLDLLGAGTASSSADPLASILGGPPAPALPLPTHIPAPPPPAASTPSSSSFAPIIAWQQPGGGLSVSFSFTKPQPGNPAITEITVTTTNSGMADVSDYSLQAAVPKSMQIKLDTATGTALPPLGGSITQKLFINNTLHGTKPLAMRLRLQWTAAGQVQQELAEVTNFPAGL